MGKGNDDHGVVGVFRMAALVAHEMQERQQGYLFL